MGKHVGGRDPDLISARIQAVGQLVPLAHRFRVALKEVSEYFQFSVSSQSAAIKPRMEPEGSRLCGL